MTKVITVNESTTAVVDSTQSVVVLSGQLGARGPRGLQGPQGPQGPAGDGNATNISGYPIVINNVGPTDLLQLSAENTWINSPLLDGGNF